MSLITRYPAALVAASNALKALATNGFIYLYNAADVEVCVIPLQGFGTPDSVTGEVLATGMPILSSSIASDAYITKYLLKTSTNVTLEGGLAGTYVCTVNTTTDTFTAIGHNFVVGDTLFFSTTATLPAPLVAGTAYFVLSSAPDSFTLSLTLGGAVINITTTGIGIHTVFKTLTAVKVPAKVLTGDIILLTSYSSKP